MINSGGKKVGGIEETPVVEIYIRCPSETKSRQSQLELRQAAKNTTKMSSSIEVKDIEFVDTSSTILCVSECEAETLRTRGQHHGLEQRYNIQEQPAENNYKCLDISIHKESLLERGNSGNEKSSSSAEMLSESSGFSSLPTLPPPRPSLWKELYLKILKPKEKSFENNLMRPSRRPLKKKEVRKLKRTHSLKKIQKSVRTNRASYFRQSSCITEVLPVNEDEIKIYDLECNREDGNESSTSVSPASTRSSAETSYDKSISVSSDENPEESNIRGNHCDKGVQTTSEMADTGKEDMVKTRERFGWQKNKNGLFNVELKTPGNKLKAYDFGKKK